MMAHAPLRHSDERRRRLDIESGVYDAVGRGEERYSNGQYIVDGMPFQQTHIKQGVSQQLASTVSENLRDGAPTRPIDVPVRRGQKSQKHDQTHRDEDAATRPGLEQRQASLHSVLHARSGSGNQPTLEKRLPKLSVNIRPRGRSMMDEFAKPRSGSSDASKKERSAVLNVASVQETVTEEALTKPTLVPSNTYSLPPVDTLMTHQDHLAGVYASPVTYTPMTGSPTSNASSWLHYGSHPPTSRRRSQRSVTGSLQNSPAANFLRQYSSNASPAPPLPDDEGQQAGDYLLGKQIAKGAFSVIREAYLATSPSASPTFAVKIVRKQLQGISESDNEEIQTLVDHEMELWRVLDHENILKLCDVHSTNFATYAFMPLSPQGSLFDAVKVAGNVGLRLDQVRSYAAQIAEALRYLHKDVRIVHRDMKLENCLIMPVHDSSGQIPHRSSQTSRVVLTDFGFASYLEPSIPYVPEEDKDGGAPGSIEYAAPETLGPPKGRQPPLSGRPDIWAFGVMLFAMIMGYRPFYGDFKPELIETVKAGDWDRELLDQRVREGAAGKPDEPGEAEKSGEISEPIHEYAQDDRIEDDSQHGINEASAAGVVANETWAKSYSTIIITDGIDPDAVCDVVKGCLTKSPADRWDITQVVESAWLAPERRAD